MLTCKDEYLWRKNLHKSFQIQPVCLVEVSLLHNFNTNSQAHQAYSMCTWALSLGVEQPGHEADHSPSSSAKISKLTYTISPTVCLWGVHRDNFTFAFMLWDEGLCKQMTKQCPISTDFHNWCFHLAIDNLFPLVRSAKLGIFF